MHKIAPIIMTELIATVRTTRSARRSNDCAKKTAGSIDEAERKMWEGFGGRKQQECICCMQDSTKRHHRWNGDKGNHSENEEQGWNGKRA